jgi:hypothetical protein
MSGNSFPTTRSYLIVSPLARPVEVNAIPER